MKRMQKAMRIVAAFVIGAMALTGCGATGSNTGGGTGETPAADSSDVSAEKTLVKIATSFPTTGEYAEYGLGFTEAVKIKVDEANADETNTQYTFEVVAYDDKLSGEESASIAELAAHDEDVVAVVGGYSSAVIMAATPVYQENGLVCISPSASHPDYTKEGDYIFRNSLLVEDEAVAAVNAMSEYLKCKRIGILAIQTEWGQSTAVTVRALAEAKGMEIAAYDEILMESDDYGVPIAKFRDADVDGVFVVGISSTLVPLAIQYRAVDPDIPIVSFSDTYNPETLELGGDSVNGVVFPLAYTNESENPQAVRFRDEFEKRLGRLPEVVAAQSYDAAGMIIEAVLRVGPDRAAVRDYLADITYDGAVGEISFNEERSVQLDLYIGQIRDGEFVIVE